MQPALGILADDLTGATDSGLQFAKSGHRTRVSLDGAVTSSAGVIVVDVDSRSCAAAQARRRVARAARQLRAAGARRFYQKIDSTGRGNLGAEIEAALDGLGIRSAVICPAFPRLGRTVCDGKIQVRGIPLDRTEFARDPLWPATTASLAEIVRRQTALWLGDLPLAMVRRGPREVGGQLRVLIEAGARLIIADAETTEDLRCLCGAIDGSEEPVLPVGSAGLAELLGEALPAPVRSARDLHVTHDPILVVAGTLNRVGLTQLAGLVDFGVPLIRLQPEAALADPDRAAREVAGRLARQARGAKCVALALADPFEPLPDFGRTVRAHHLELAAAAARVVNALGAAASQALAEVAPASLVLTGGDTARAVCGALGARGLDIAREAAPGIPISLLEGGRWDGLPVATKAGGFGHSDTLVRVVRVLEEMRR